jgi:hypothetical protein
MRLSKRPRTGQVIRQTFATTRRGRTRHQSGATIGSWVRGSRVAELQELRRLAQGIGPNEVRSDVPAGAKEDEVLRRMLSLQPSKAIDGEMGRRLIDIDLRKDSPVQQLKDRWPAVAWEMWP